MRAAFVDIAGVRTRYLHEGQGQPLLLLHGVGTSADTFFPVIDSLGQRFTVCVPDLLGHGFTDAIDLADGPPQPRMVAHLGALVDRLGFRSYSVAGSSYGGLLAALMYFDRPQQVDKLVIIGSGSAFHPQDEQIKTLQGALANASSAMEHPTLQTCRQRLANICFDPKSVPEDILLTQLTSYALPDRFKAYKATIAGLMDSEKTAPHRVIDRLEQIKAPTLIITGRDDIRASWRRAVDAERRMPNATLVIYEKCGHLPYCEHPERFVADVRGFLEA